MKNEMIQVITKASLKEDFEARKLAGGVYPGEPVTMAETRFGKNLGRIAQDKAFDLAFSAKTFGSSNPLPKITGKYGTALAAPVRWSDGKLESVMDRVKRGAFASSTNTLLPDWQQFWETMRIDLTSRKAALPTIRGFLYNMYARPDADKTNKVNAMLPWNVTFEEINAEGQALPLGQKYAGLADTFDIKVYGAAFIWTLLAALFDKSLDMTQLNDAVAVGYNSLLDNLAIAPLIAYAYGNAGTAKHTAADATAGADKHELLYRTLETAIEDLAKRKHPLNVMQPIAANDLVYLGSENSARHVARVASGLPTNTSNRYFPQLAEISRIVGYDGEATKGYAGIGDVYGYLVKKNEFMDIFTKRSLTAEIDMQPDVKTLAQEERAWWFAEGIYTGSGDYGLGAFIQKITLPAW
ncbi:MAG: hypothetical protein IMZ69_08395 [Spirochaetes bacterium]|nr:hypothetical protein [Spirochaetota bacterium]